VLFLKAMSGRGGSETTVRSLGVGVSVVQAEVDRPSLVVLGGVVTEVGEDVDVEVFVVVDVTFSAGNPFSVVEV